MCQKTCQSWLAVDLCQSWLAQDQCYDFFLLSDWLIQNLPLFWFCLWCHLCHLWRQNCAYFGNPDWNFINKSMSLFYKFWLLYWKKLEASLLWSLSRLLVRHIARCKKTWLLRAIFNASIHITSLFAQVVKSLENATKKLQGLTLRTICQSKLGTYQLHTFLWSERCECS